MPPRHAKTQPATVLSVGRWLARFDGAQSDWSSLWPSLERQTALQAEVDRFCADAGCGATRVREHAPQLMWWARNASQASKLRNMRLSLQKHLAERGWHFSAVAIKIQPEKTSRHSSQFVQKPLSKPGLNPAQVAQWEALHKTLEPGKLRDAVEKLIAHHRIK